MVLSFDENTKQQYIMNMYNKYSSPIEDYLQRFSKRTYNDNFLKMYESILEKNNVLACLRAMKNKYDEMMNSAQSFEEQKKIIFSVKVLKKFIETYSKEIISKKFENEKFQQTKEILFEKAKTLLANEIEDYKNRLERQAQIEKQINKQIEQEKEEKLDQVLDGIKNL